MIILHKAKRIDNEEEVKGFLTKMFGSYHIILQGDENTAYPVSEESITPCNNTFTIESRQYNPIPYIQLIDFIQLGNLNKIILTTLASSEEYRITNHLKKVVYEGDTQYAHDYFYWRVENYSILGIFKKKLLIEISPLN